VSDQPAGPLATCQHEFPEGWCPLCLRHEIAGHEKAFAILQAGFASLCDLMDCLKQESRRRQARRKAAVKKLRAARSEVARLRAELAASAPTPACPFCAPRPEPVDVPEAERPNCMPATINQEAT
jgi:hypothetical protein